MAVVETGTREVIECTGQSGSTSITVPADCDCAVFCCSGFTANANKLTDYPPTINSVSMASDASCDANDGYFMGEVYRLLSPATGSRTFAWSWFQDPPNDIKGVMIYLKGVHQSTPRRDYWEEQTGSHSSQATDSLNTDTSDLAVAFKCEYATSAITHTWTNANELGDYDWRAFNSSCASLATKTPTGSTLTITASLSSTADDGSFMAVVYAPAAAAGSSTPKASTMTVMGVN